MSDKGSQDHAQEQERAPRRKRPRACDQCRKRKVRCDGPEEEGRPCLTCVAFRDKCTYTPNSDLPKMRQVDEEYIKAMESEIKRLRFLVQQLQAKLQEKERSIPTGTDITGGTASSRVRTPSAAEATVKEEEADDHRFLEGLRALKLHDIQDVRFMGPASYFPLIKVAVRMRKELGEESNASQPTEDNTLFPRRRTQFWVHLSDYIPLEPPYTEFPDPTLMTELLDSYRRTIHGIFPILHWPTFLQGVTSCLHLVDEAFGAIVLLVCALGARFSDHPAVLLPGATSWQLAGWEWFEQVRGRRKLLPLTSVTLHDVQVSVLSAAYVATLGLPHAIYPVVGHGVRLLQDLGAHRRATYDAISDVEGEMLKRAFWCLLVMDAGLCTILGRPCSIQSEDFDVDYPIECDDEYWTSNDPQKAFKQPHGQPSVVSHFVLYIKLTQIHARALRTMYSQAGTKDLQDPEYAQHVVADLDSELNRWIDSLPQHLKYDPAREDVPFAVQAASLHATYLSLRIFVHRPFITRSYAASLPVPSLAICTNAARLCISVLERYFALAGPALIYQYHIGTLLSAAIVLLLHVWQKIRSEMRVEAVRELEHVHKALSIYKSLESHWDAAGRSWDILQDLVSVVDSRVQHGLGLEVSDSTRRTDLDLPLGSVAPVVADYYPRDTGLPSSIIQPDITTAVTDCPAATLDPDIEAIFAHLVPTRLHGGAFDEPVQQAFQMGVLFSNPGTVFPGDVPSSSTQGYSAMGSTSGHSSL